MSIKFVSKIDDLVQVQNVLISVSDKSNLEFLVLELIKINPNIKIFSTGGTYAKIEEILNKDYAKNLVSVSDYTGQPETDGGLVKTLDFKIYLGLLTETYNDLHQADLKRTDAVAIDIVIVNLYPFSETIAKENVTLEQARGNIDIGGPCMIRASAKNFLRVASVVDPLDYEKIISNLKENNGNTSLKLRYKLAQKAYGHTASYDKTIAAYLQSNNFENILKTYTKIV